METPMPDQTLFTSLPSKTAAPAGTLHPRTEFQSAWKQEILQPPKTNAGYRSLHERIPVVEVIAARGSNRGWQRLLQQVYELLSQSQNTLGLSLSTD